MSDTKHASRLVDLQGAADLTGMSVKTLRRFCYRGELASVRVGGTGKFWVERVELDAFIERNRRPVGVSP